MADDEQPAIDPPTRRRSWSAALDWTAVIGGIGRVLIASGLLLFGFVAYQLWGTGLHTARAQDRLEAQFVELLDTAAAPTPTTPTTAPPPPAPATTARPPDATAAPSEPTAPPTAPGSPASVTGTADAAPAGTLRLGGPIARLEVPTAGIDHIVVEGVRVTDLRDGPGHFPETPMPGQVGNAAIAGHRTTYGQPFIDIDRAAVGDDVVVTTPWGRFVYVVSAISIVPPEAYAEVIPTTDPTRATLTLVSCHPKYSSRERLILRADLDPARSDPLVETVPLVWASGEPAAGGTAPVEPSPGSGDPLAPVPSTAPATTVVTTAPTTAPATAPTTVPTTVPTSLADTTGTTGTTAPTAGAGAEVFSDRWFSDPEAFAPVGLWGLLLAAIAIAATALSRWRRSNWWGLLIGIAPFLVVLYTWFGQVARLLPPNL